IMKSQGGGRILNIGSISAQRPRVNSAPYASSKFGLVGLTTVTALEGREFGISACCLHPGNVQIESSAEEIGAICGIPGYSSEPQFAAGKPIIGICSPSSELNNCEMGLKELVEPVKRGVAQAGGIALEFPTMGLGGEFLKPSDLPYRNLASMDIEETVRGNPI